MIRRTLCALGLSALLSGCNMVVMNPAGDVALQQRDLVLVSTILMLLIIVPVIALIALFAWRYRNTNTDARYEPDWDHSTQLELVIWAAPLLIIICLGAITWVGTHLLDPYRPIGRTALNKPVAPDAKPLEVQVVALDWKWLFIYPEQGIATVNELAAPVDRPIMFKITASSVMNSFYVPALAGQIYAMPGMETKLHAVINKPGDYAGFSANYSGAGFSGMRFRFHGMTDGDFAKWVANAKQGKDKLDRNLYLQLEKPSEKEPVRRFASVDPALYNAALNMCVRPGTPCMADLMRKDMEKDAEGRAGHGAAEGHAAMDHGAMTGMGHGMGHGMSHDMAGMTMPMPQVQPQGQPPRSTAKLTGAGLTPPPSPFRKPQAVALEAPAAPSARPVEPMAPMSMPAHAHNPSL